MKVIGCGVGRTGTMSLKLAVNALGFGPCHHMEMVLANLAVQVPLWNDAHAGRPDWAATYDGFDSAVDWPTAAFFRELMVVYPDARFILTERNADNWASSFGATIYRLLGMGDEAPPEQHEWLAMANRIISKTGFPPGLSHDELKARFEAHNAAVRETIPADRLLVYEVKQGWAPLCEFLGVTAPEEPFPRTNDRSEFWDLVSGKG